MSEPRAFPYGGVPVYNPLSLSKDEALAQFYARQTAYESLMDLLRQERPSHVLIIGTRGMGKTTLLQRVNYGVEDDPELNSRYLVLAFPEEQYNVNRLHRFLLNTVDALADAMERLRNERMLARVEAFAEMAGKLSQEEVEERVPRFLAEVGHEMRKSLLLLVDNADRLFETIDDQEQWRLRELLSNRRDLTFFGATTQASDGIYGPKRAFFEFFQIHNLTPLTLEEVRTLLLRLSESVEEREGEKGSAKRRVQEWLDADAARLRTLVQLTGGNPRTTVLLFHLVLDGLDGGAREYLEQLLDQCTPGYKGRVDELPPQAQQVLDAVALRWDPVTAMEVAEYTGLDTSTVSAQLTRLSRQGVLEKADPGDSKKALYQVAERFFNIWYLMRASRRVRAKLRWFVEFLRVFFDRDKLEEMTWERLERFRGAGRTRPEEIENAFAYALAWGADRSRIEDYLRKKCADMEPECRPYLDALAGASAVKAPEGANYEPANLARWVQQGMATMPPTDLKPNAARYSTGRDQDFSGVLDILNGMEAKLRRAMAVEPESALLWSCLGFVLAAVPERREEAEAALLKANTLDPALAWTWAGLGGILSATPEREAESELAFQRAIELDPEFEAFWKEFGFPGGTSPGPEAVEKEDLWRTIGLDAKCAWVWGSRGDRLAWARNQDGAAEAAYRKAIEMDPDSALFWRGLGHLLGKAPERGEEAEAALRKAIELDPKNAWIWDRLGDLLGRTPERTEEAEAAYRKAIELDPNSAVFWNDFGNLLGGTPERREEAEAALRKAIELDPNSASPWDSLGDILTEIPERRAEAEAAYREAIKLDPNSAWFWSDLGSLLGDAPERADEAEAAYRKAIELSPNSAWFWSELAFLLLTMPDRLNEVDSAFGKALEIDPSSGHLWSSFGFFLACRAGKPREAEVALRKSVELEPESFRTLRNLGVLLYCEKLDEEEAVRYIRRAHELRLTDPVSAATLAACTRGLEAGYELLPVFLPASGQSAFWDEVLELCQNYAPFGKILLGICDLVQEHDPSNRFVPLHRAVALAQLGDFPRASVALEDALVGDPIDLLSTGRMALEVIFAAAVRNGRVRDCLELLDKKEWKDAWRPIYEALRSVEEGSGEYLKRVAVEIREPALQILRRIAPGLPGLPARTR